MSWFVNKQHVSVGVMLFYRKTHINIFSTCFSGFCLACLFSYMKDVPHLMKTCFSEDDGPGKRKGHSCISLSVTAPYALLVAYVFVYISVT